MASKRTASGLYTSTDIPEHDSEHVISIGHYPVVNQLIKDFEASPQGLPPNKRYNEAIGMLNKWFSDVPEYVAPHPETMERSLLTILMLHNFSDCKLKWMGREINGERPHTLADCLRAQFLNWEAHALAIRHANDSSVKWDRKMLDHNEDLVDGCVERAMQMNEFLENDTLQKIPRLVEK